MGYIAPEILKSDFYDIKKTDIFALTVILFIMVTGLPPFQVAQARKDPYYKSLLLMKKNGEYKKTVR